MQSYFILCYSVQRTSKLMYQTYCQFHIIHIYNNNCSMLMQALIMRQLLLRKGEGRTDVLGLAMALRSTR